MKPQNVLLDEAHNVKLADFGFAVTSTDFDLSTCLGTPAYMAPEVIKNEKYGKPVDIWAIGVIIHQLYTGELPFKETRTKKELFECIK